MDRGVGVKVLIAIPALDFMSTDCAMSLGALLMNHAYDKRLKREVKLALTCAKGTIIPHSRNLLVAQAVDISATHIFFLDSDMTLPPDALDRLIAHHVPIVGADYVRRVPPHQLNGRPVPGVNGHRNGLIPMLTMPFGVMLISMKVFADMPPPHFSYREGATDADTMSEDTYWCNEARRRGHTIWCDSKLSREVGHVGTRVFRAGN